MTNNLAFSRRLFLGGVIGMTAAGFIKTRAEIPTLWGDLIHDDAPALNALFRGEPIRVIKGLAIEGDSPAIRGAKMLVRSPIIASDHAFMDKCTVVAGLGFEGEELVRLAGFQGVIQNSHFDMRHVDGLTCFRADGHDLPIVANSLVI